MVITIAAILGMVAAPAFRTAVMNNRIVTETNDFVGDLNYARIEAIKRSTDVNLCASANGTTCNGSANWATGWIVYWDSNNSSTFDTGEPILRKHAALSANTTLNASSSTSQVVFLRSGEIDNTTALDFDLCDDRGALQGRNIEIAPTGRPSINTKPSTCTPP